MIRNARLTDAQDICDIYNYYIQNTTITFEEKELDKGEIEKRIKEVINKYPWFVNEEDGRVTGYAYAGLWKWRAAYRNTVEVTVYVEKNSTGKGIGRKLLEVLLEELSKNNIHCVIGGIALPNAASIELHEKLGFIKCAHFTQVGYKFGEWIDVEYWQKHLERK
ncbi:MAG: N-acetyltransferase family protein [Bacteroidota bacterium]|nr:N-acetyltransferase family protein [Bacteroidota bacterium]